MRSSRVSSSCLDEQVKRVFLDDYQRTPDAEELRLAGQYGLVTLCRSLFNSNL
jgi:hypothetical protein